MKKQSYRAQEFDLGLESATSPAKAGGSDLLVVAPAGAELSPAQAEFNKLMKRLEKQRTSHKREQERLDTLVAICVGELMPLVEELHRLNFQMVIQGAAAMKKYKFTARRRDLLADLFRCKAGSLISDSCGLTEEEVERMRDVTEELSTAELRQAEKENEKSEFAFLRGEIESAARQAGVDLDLSDLDIHGDPAEFERLLQARLAEMISEVDKRPPPARGRARKQTKAQIEKEKRRQEAEEMKNRDLKSLYKQLAKVLHPDLETDPERKLQKEEWMKRLTTAHASADLRELLSIEMEWLGVEASNLANATDQKLKVYCTVLKEQIAEIKMQTQFLLDQPQYFVLNRFKHPFSFRFVDPAFHKSALQDEIERFGEMLDLLKNGGAECAQMLNRWADDHARFMRDEACPF